MQLLPKDALLKTGPVDHADWNYRPVLGWLQRQRFQLIHALLPQSRSHRLLEIGYGSGVFMPELARHCIELHGIDIHECHQAVATRLREHGVEAQIVSGSAEQLPYPQAWFDCVVAVSSLEFVENIDRASLELRRVLTPGGCLVLVTPGKSPLLDMGLRALTGQNASDDFGARREALVPALLRHFQVSATRVFPFGLGAVTPLYTAFRLT